MVYVRAKVGRVDHAATGAGQGQLHFASLPADVELRRKLVWHYIGAQMVLFVLLHEELRVGNGCTVGELGAHVLIDLP